MEWCTCVYIHVVLLFAHYQFGAVFPSDVELWTKCVCTDRTEVTSGRLTLSTVYQVYCVMFLYQLSGSCGTPRSLSNGERSYSRTTVGSRVTYTCNTGYLRTSGSSRRTCQSDGQWSGSHPTCTRKSALCHFIFFTYRLQTCKRIDCMHNNPFHF